MQRLYVLLGILASLSLLVFYTPDIIAQDYFGKFPPTTAFRNFTDGTDTIEAGGYADTITFEAGANMTLTFIPATNTIIFASQGGGGGPGGGHTQINSIACAMNEFLSAFDNGTSFFTCTAINLSGGIFENVTMLNETNQYFTNSVQFFRNDINLVNATNSTLFSVNGSSGNIFIAGDNRTAGSRTGGEITFYNKCVGTFLFL